MRQLPERLFLVLLLLLSLPVFNPVSGAFRAASFEWQEDRKGTFQLPLLIPEIEEECEEEKDEKEKSGIPLLFTEYLNITFRKEHSQDFHSAVWHGIHVFAAAGGQKALRLNCVWRI